VAQLTLEAAREDRQRLPVQVQPLEDDRRARFKVAEDAVDVRGRAEGSRAPGNVDRVVVQLDPLALLDQPEGGVTDSARADQPLDVCLGEERIESARLSTGDDERLLLPVLGEKFLGRDGLDAAC
jgi:hypothetical protein